MIQALLRIAVALAFCVGVGLIFIDSPSERVPAAGIGR